jgi:imidazole glycerol-phosphate synthase subunit HisH
MIVILDYGMGNVGSIQNMIKKFTTDVVITNNHDMIKDASKLILPGVGAFDNGMKNLKSLNLIDILNDKVLKEKIPVLGICLGMQLLTEKSEEGVLEGLKWIKGETVRFRFINNNNVRLKVPHMGWNYIETISDSKLFENLYKETRYYFVHSYYVTCKNRENVIAETKYGIRFTSAVQDDNIFGVQFHPEKSHKYGLQLIKNFIDL